MHLLDPDDPHHILDGLRVCDARAHLPEPEALNAWVTRFTLIADQTRLALLLCIHHTGEICVSDLAAATGIRDSTVSQALRVLRAHGVVTTRRDGRTIHYQLADDSIRALIDQVDDPVRTSSTPHSAHGHPR